MFVWHTSARRNSALSSDHDGALPVRWKWLRMKRAATASRWTSPKSAACINEHSIVRYSDPADMSDLRTDHTDHYDYIADTQASTNDSSTNTSRSFRFTYKTSMRNHRETELCVSPSNALPKFSKCLLPFTSFGNSGDTRIPSDSPECLHQDECN